ncbi:MAG: 3-isopropylmalate dehydrogenase [Mariniblastus sp.]|nr:3-isopropylmalate dehydrogenase [Mariniblastus sp.]MDG2182976.1 3-isopropylmalate dehydrogenase [Mariniblastus sp.]
MKKSGTVAVLPGDGIGHEVTQQAIRVLEKLNSDFSTGLECTTAPVGGTAYDLHGHPLPPETLALARRSDAVLLGAVGGPQWEKIAREHRPERALLSLRSELELFSNLRPALLFPELASASTLKPEVVSGLDIMIVRELTGGIYFGEPRAMTTDENGIRIGYNTMVYREPEIRRIAHSAFQVAQQRDKRVCSVDKANVMEVSELWREVVTDVSSGYPEVELSHMYIDNACMQLVRAPKQFDVIVTTNLFGDILSDAASMLTGSIGMLPSASLDSSNKGMYEPVHGSAPDIAGQNIANPLATILSVAMMLRTTFENSVDAQRIENAVKNVLSSGLRTADIALEGENVIGTSEMGDAVVAGIK